MLEARRPSEARRICAGHGAAIDLLLTDVIMPECTGTDLARELSGLHPHMRVVYMSGYPGGAASRAGALTRRGVPGKALLTSIFDGEDRDRAEERQRQWQWLAESEPGPRRLSPVTRD